MAVAIAAVAIFSGFLTSQKTVEYTAILSVTPPSQGRIGVSIDQTDLNFGIVSAGNNVIKTLKLSNPDLMPAKVTLSAEGNISSFLQFENYHYLKERESREVNIKAQTNQTGNYSGRLTVIIKKPRFQFISWLLPIL